MRARREILCSPRHRSQEVCVGGWIYAQLLFHGGDGDHGCDAPEIAGFTGLTGAAAAAATAAAPVRHWTASHAMHPAWRISCPALLKTRFNPPRVLIDFEIN